MTEQQIAQLLAPFLNGRALSEAQLALVLTYLDLLLKWNARLNLTAIRNPEEVVTRHFGESLFAARQLFPSNADAGAAVDIGSGPGFPGIPLKLWNSSLQMTLIESNQRKATFLREVVRALKLGNVEVLAIRAESLSLQADLVTFRAVEKFERTLAVARSLVKPGGRIAILIGEAQAAIAQRLLPEVQWREPLAVPGSSNRVLLVGVV